ncbi:unnamed protein product [Clonostachys byssicola]|uniref:Zn(2)-C6 fungal-type domain-containing protein n=1 Tax=Clonostachys byssicola TaxID=160290 RepID=A0A9N9UFZ7_9HYPO|nr:unnamed protein product [Clonostachys byssicola]
MTPTARRNTKACASCHVRKVRCDVARVGFPCTKCRADEFECVTHIRKRRETKTERANSDRSQCAIQPHQANSIPEHMMRYKFPYYAFFRGFAPRGHAWFQARDQNHGVLLPVPMHDQSAPYIVGLNDRPAEDIQFLKAKGALDLPSKEAIDIFVSDYFRLFHPFFPIIDRQKFLKSLRESHNDSTSSCRRPSLLLLQAVIFTASSSVPVETIHAIGFSSRKEARNVLHGRIRHLYNFNYEPDDVTNIQALLLMSHYFPSMMDQKHTWLWVHQAISLAQGAGLHRDSGRATQKKLWARIWWACLIRDRLIALGTGRPMHINSLDCNVPQLVLADLQEEGDEQDDLNVKAIFVEFAKLCQYMEGILTLPLASSETLPKQLELCRKTLAHWYTHLNPVALRCMTRDIDEESVGVLALYRGVLHLIYNTLQLALHHSGRVLQDNQASTSRVPSPEVQALAEDSARLAEGLMKLEMIGAPTICVTSILPPIAIHLQGLRLKGEDCEKRQSKIHFQTCMQFLKRLGEVYWHANFYHDIFELAASTPLSRVVTGAKNPIQATGRRSQFGERLLTDRNEMGRDNSDSHAGLSTLTTNEIEFALSTESAMSSTFFGYNGDDLQDVNAVFGDESLVDGDLLNSWFDDNLFLQNIFPLV